MTLQARQTPAEDVCDPDDDTSPHQWTTIRGIGRLPTGQPYTVAMCTCGRVETRPRERTSRAR